MTLRILSVNSNASLSTSTMLSFMIPMIQLLRMKEKIRNSLRNRCRPIMQMAVKILCSNLQMRTKKAVQSLYREPI